MTISDELSRFIVDLDYESLPKDVIEKAKLCTLDLVGVTLQGSTMPWANYTYEVFKNMGGKQESRVLHYGDRIPCPNAAMVNGTMAHSYEFDDCDLYDISHPGMIVIPTALATAERNKANGKQFISAIVAGYEILVRLYLSVNPINKPSHSFEGFNTTTAQRAFGSAATAGKIFGLDRFQLANAFGLASTFSSGNTCEWTVSGSWTNYIHPGKSNYDGIICALLSEKGFKGPLTVFESGDRDLESLTENLGRKWLILGTMFKSYPCDSFIHPAVEATLKIVQKYRIRSIDIEKIVPYIGSKSYAWNAKDFEKRIEPKSIQAAQSSLPFCIAIAAIHGGISVEDFSPERIQDIEIKSLAKRVEPIIDTEFDKPNWMLKTPARVEIRTKDGRSYSEQVESAKGFTDNPFTKEEVIEKFMRITKGIFKPNKTRLIVNKILRLEEVDNIEELTRLLA